MREQRSVACWALKGLLGAGILLAALARMTSAAAGFAGPIVVTERDWGYIGVSSHEITWLAPNDLFVTYTSRVAHLRVSRSRDGGFDWPGAVQINDPGDDYAGGISSPVRLDAGSLGVVWLGWTFADRRARIYFARLDSLGERIDEPTPLALVGSSCCDVLPQLRRGGRRLVALWYRPSEEPEAAATIASFLSEDLGASWSEYREFGPTSDEPLRPTPSLAVGPDGTFYACISDGGFPGRVLVFRLDPNASEWVSTSEIEPDVPRVISAASLAVGSDGILGLAFTLLNEDYVGPGSIRFLTSRDRGATWSDGVAFDTAGSEAFGISDARLAADLLGRWHLAWCNPQSPEEGAVYYARSIDRWGHEWTSPTRVTPVSEPARLQAPHSIGITTDDRGHVVVTFLRSLGTFLDAIYLLTTRERPVDGLEDLPFFAVSASPNPFRERTTFALPVPDPATARLQIYDAQGGLVRTWPAISLVRGENPVSWDGWMSTGKHAAPGVYYWRARITDGKSGAVHDVRGRVVRGQR
jgi:hypothetical protein